MTKNNYFTYRTTGLLFFFLALNIFCASAQEPIKGGDVPDDCRTQEAMDLYFENNPGAKEKERMKNNAIKSIIEEMNSGQMERMATYTIPVVIHVFGTEFNGGTIVTNEIIQDALNKTNEDFQGLAEDWNTIIPQFTNIKQEMNISFELAQLDPNGSPTTGVVYYPEASGMGNYGNPTVAEVAWDNYKYCNVYITRDLYDDGSLTNSGVAWYPNDEMSDLNIARVVYNGSYLGTNTDENFRSVLTHEFGHYLDLRHTFIDGCPDSGSCSDTGDLICDTPAADIPNMNGATNCNGVVTNYQNFMDYSNTYAMYTADQVARMEAALNLPSRVTLWQQSNLAATGIGVDLGPRVVFGNNSVNEDIENNGAVSNVIALDTFDGLEFAVSSGDMVAGTHFTATNVPPGLTFRVRGISNVKAELYVSGNASSHTEEDGVHNISFTFLDAAFSTHEASQILGASSPSISINFLDPYKFQHDVFQEDNSCVAQGNAWDFFKCGSEGPEFGMFWYPGDEIDALRIGIFGADLGITGVRDITRFNNGDIIDSNTNWGNPGDIGGGDETPILLRNGYNAWQGEIGYIGVRYEKSNQFFYGWIKIAVSADGLSARPIAYGYSETPDEAVTAGEVPDSMIVNNSFVFYEQNSNNGQIRNAINYEIQGNKFFKSDTGNLFLGSDYTITGLPLGLSASMSIQNNKNVLLTLSGSAIENSVADSRPLKVTFNDSAFQDNNTTNLTNVSSSLEVRFKDPNKIVHHIYADGTLVNSGNEIERYSFFDNRNQEFGTFGINSTTFTVSPDREIILEASGKQISNFNTATRQVTSMSVGTQIGPSTNFTTSDYFIDGNPLLSSSSFTTYHGQSIYLGAKFRDEASREYYGWMRISISQDGQSAIMEEQAYNSTPGQPINVGETGDNVPCFSGESFGTDESWIKKVKLSNLSQSSPFPNVFTDNTHKTILGIPGADVQFSIEVSQRNPHSVVVWIDTNNDNDFDDAGEKVYETEIGLDEFVHSGRLILPNVEGDFRVRVGAKFLYDTIPPLESACERYEVGETEDYTINIDSSNPIFPEVQFSANATNIVANDFVVFTDQTANSPTSWDWDLTGATQSSSTDQNPVARYPNVGEFSVGLSATNSGATGADVKENYIIVTEAPSDYCETIITDEATRYIESVILGDINNSSTQGLQNGYSDYTDQSTTLEAGQTYEMSVEVNDIIALSYASNYITVWIDFGQNNDFSAADSVLKYRATEADANSGVYPPLNITIPSYVPDGEYRMRVMHAWHYNEDDSFLAACSGSNEGEVEDYTVNIVGETLAIGSTNTTPDEIKIYPNPVKGSSLNVSTPTDNLNLSYKIYNVLGQVISKSVLNTSTIDVSGIQSGVYIIEFYNDGNDRTVKRFVIE